VEKTTVIYVEFLFDAACQNLLKSTSVMQSYSKNNTGTAFFETWCSCIWSATSATVCGKIRFKLVHWWQSYFCHTLLQSVSVSHFVTTVLGVWANFVLEGGFARKIFLWRNCYANLQNCFARFIQPI